VSGAGSPQQSGSPPTTSQRGSARRDFEGRERELMEEASSSDASSQPEAVASPRSSREIHTHTRTHEETHHTPHGSITTSFFCTSSLPLSVIPPTLPLLFHSLSPFAQDRIVTLAPSEQSRLLPGIATSTSNAARPPKPACVSASVSLASAPLVLSLLSVRVLE
jgi:hypothetical protein